MTVVIGADRSGAGKTTVTLALLAYLAQYGSVQAFKVGPDYIDPMFHAAMTARPCRNLDPVLTSATYVQQCFARHCWGARWALVEGVMGLFDGVPIADVPDFASTAHVARLLELPVLLVLDCQRLSGSIAAIVSGFCSFDPRVRVAGVVLNRVGSDRHLELLSMALEPLQVPILGVLRRDDRIAIPDRHLGLVPTDELAHLAELRDCLSDLAATRFDWEQLLPLLAAPQRSHAATTASVRFPARVGIARDRAFNFYYPDNLDLLAALGAELVEWSPLSADTLPDVQGLYLGGGFPEVFAAELAANRSLRDCLRAAIVSNMPVYAECGGLMFLCRQLVDFSGRVWEMVGALPATATMGARLTLGYRQAIALRDSPLFRCGEVAWGHEFHRSTLGPAPDRPLFRTQGLAASTLIMEGWQTAQLHASYIHLHWGTRSELPARFLERCQHWGE
ncbi:cobyrinic acid a,c-diamide synthase [Rubidibacter lacunae KORDI 51-2]|uniref:Cobyrinate a,c-diamide synthase n=1 Tax=Rubidibacter lacunae KORDI 51-2 TaxID=582515 RepID=U5D6X3_9CHRO|nr:cobyrinic acid a,c-diamide synthase [Rubidibacter lacunae KORDI 51-2]